RRWGRTPAPAVVSARLHTVGPIRTYHGDHAFSSEIKTDRFFQFFFASSYDQLNVVMGHVKLEFKGRAIRKLGFYNHAYIGPIHIDLFTEYIRSSWSLI